MTVPGGVQSVYKKYSLGSRGVWELLRRLFVVDPNRSTGVPLNAFNRFPSPAEIDPAAYKDPTTVPAADIADNPYWKRDVRRAYPRPSMITQGGIVGLLELGSVAQPRIADGEAGTKQLVEVQQQEGKLATVLNKDQSKIAQILATGGLPPTPGPGYRLEIDHEAGIGYPDRYPCRSFK